MIVTPEFCEHWKTRLLVEITGDAAAPLALLRLWGHCQTSKRWVFPKMTLPQLTSICHWGDRKPRCDLALIKCGFLEKLPGGGFKVHDWDVWNGQLIQKWKAGEKGGRPPANENTQQNQGNQETDRLSDANRSETDRPDRPDQIDRTRPDQTSKASGISGFPPAGKPAARGGVGVQSLEAGGGLVGAGEVNELVKQITKGTRPFKAPSLTLVAQALQLNGSGLEAHAEAVHALGEKQGWRDKDGKPLTDWRKWAGSVAAGLERKARGVGE